MITSPKFALFSFTEVVVAMKTDLPLSTNAALPVLSTTVRFTHDTHVICMIFISEKNLLLRPPTPQPYDLEERPRFCSLRFDIGPCEHYIHKWFFDASTGECDTFAYGGCGGNKNRFDTQAECQHFCLGSHCKLYLEQSKAHSVT